MVYLGKCRLQLNIGNAKLLIQYTKKDKVINLLLIQ